MNNYNDFGGRPQYVEWARDRGENVTSDDDFYRNEIVKGYYKNHVKVMYIERERERVEYNLINVHE